MPTSTYRGRRAVFIENGQLRVTILVEGGHIAEVLDKRSGINPLWTPHWDSIEPSTFDASRHASYGGPTDGALLAGIMGHNLCLDIFGGPSPEEAAAGLTAHGEASIVQYAIEMNGSMLIARADLPHAGLRLQRRLELRRSTVVITETVTNLTACDRPVGWTQHVTLGPPFLKNGVTEFRASATRSKVFEGTFGPADYLVPGDRRSTGPMHRERSGGTVDLQRYTDAPCLERLHRAPDGPLTRRGLLRGALIRRPSSRSATSGAVRIFRGWASGRKTAAGQRRHGTVARSRAGWNSASRLFPRHGAR